MLVKYKLCELGEILTGNTPSKKNGEFYDTKDIMFIKPDDINNNITEIECSKEYISNKAEKKARIIPKDSLLITCIGSIGKIAINKEKSAFNQQINSIVHNEKIISSKYLAYVLMINKRRLESISNAPVVPIINKTQFSEFEVYIHEEKEIQQKIVNVLDKAQSLIDKRKAQIEALDELVKSRFVEMFGHPSKNERGWNTKTFADISTVRQGLQIPISKRKTEPAENCLKYITIQFLNGAKSEEYIENPKQNVICNTEDVLMTRTGNTGMVVSNVRGVFHNNFFLIDFDRSLLNKVFLVNYLNDNYIQADIIRRAGTSTIPDLNHSEFYKVKILLPPMKLQMKFEDFVNQVDKLKFEMEKSLKELEDNFNSLMQKAFKGELFN
ncbi:restriction endonuclease subunit S [Clostridium botulinum]|uniref:restriction endonuclease subunit S n=1 Tax=Clostridium botulinum TaxID=1491 RepID=UPI00077313C6|nr:restriction endonuclease subunit S [Clostridium botulinum]APU59581.1 type I restriction modification DNA specificity domain protein [Clostridium botulinum]AUN02317.1 type I restriction endonuclease subunit S [Clostridium botulinum]MBN3397659.1 restriction endonuclease subunit S [Clostridium botulinum]MBN3411934.1 restriction endonuclease subunit S [Clostridium botulinum]NFB30407.1 restriction endonuclease subunit S [Clostridium botulinum]